ncbi:Predicted secreted Zn-dependent protease [Aureimonas phyllosphaerae]|nr:Predicted secreted Zn-dependent protease [Aureimonas phyllosphaerae]
MRRLLISSLAAGCMFTGSAHAAEITERTTYFMVRGATFAELDRALGTNGPLLGGGERHAGATKVTFTRDLQFDIQKTGCRIARTNLRLDLVTTLPRWNAPRGADARTRTMWKVLQRDIAEHEAKHSTIAKNWLDLMNRELLALPPEPSCARLEVKAAHLSQQMQMAHAKEQNGFDRAETRVVDSRLNAKLAAATKRAAP